MDKDWQDRQLKFACETFDCGQFNDILYAYTLEAMMQAEIPPDMAKKILTSVHHQLDQMTAWEAVQKYYHGGLR